MFSLKIRATETKDREKTNLNPRIRDSQEIVNRVLKKILFITWSMYYSVSKGSKEEGRWGQKMAIFLIYSTIYADVGGWAYKAKNMLT